MNTSAATFILDTNCLKSSTNVKIVKISLFLHEIMKLVPGACLLSKTAHIYKTKACYIPMNKKKVKNLITL